MKIIVKKFGGTSVANTDCIQNVAKIIVNTYKSDYKVVVVVSAQGDTTDTLITQAKQLNKFPSNREMDMLLSTGEQISASLLAIAIEKLKYPVISLTGWQAGIFTDENHFNAKIKKIYKERILKELKKNKIVIVAGFQGIDSINNNITTLGRGGSDTTAVALAAILNAEVCKIYTDVDGVFTCDPRIIFDAKKIDEITYDEMLELSTLGSQVLHHRSVEIAKKYNVNLEVLSSFNKKNLNGTKVGEIMDIEKTNISAITKDDTTTQISVIGLNNIPGVAFKLFKCLSENKIDIDLIIQSIGYKNKKNISFTINENLLDKTKNVLYANQVKLEFEKLNINKNVSKVSIIGANMVSNPGVASDMFEALFNANINIHMITTSDIKISVLIDIQDSIKAIQFIHKKFF